MRILVATLLLFGLGCSTPMKKIDNTLFIHDKSSKVWLIDQLLENGRDYTPVRFEYREMIVFHESGNAYFYVIHEFGKQKGKKMEFRFNAERNEFSFEGNGKYYLFDVIQLSRTKIILKPKNKSYRFTIVLIPFPEY